jgi:hypothetical protein
MGFTTPSGEHTQDCIRCKSPYHDSSDCKEPFCPQSQRITRRRRSKRKRWKNHTAHHATTCIAMEVPHVPTQTQKRGRFKKPQAAKSRDKENGTNQPTPIQTSLESVHTRTKEMEEPEEAAATVGQKNFRMSHGRPWGRKESQQHRTNGNRRVDEIKKQKAPSPPKQNPPERNPNLTAPSL